MSSKCKALTYNIYLARILT